MKKIVIAVVLFSLFFGIGLLFFSNNASAKCSIERSGCCSHHGGVCGCSNGRARCCDGTLSPSCGCY